MVNVDPSFQVGAINLIYYSCWKEQALVYNLRGSGQLKLIRSFFDLGAT